MSDWSFACPDWVDRLKSGRSLLPDLPLDPAEAARAVAIFNRLRLPDVPGMPTLAEAAGEWQRDIVRAIFGSMEGGARMVPEVFLMVPKKNSKTTGGAAIALTAMLMNERPRAEFFYVGPTQEIADLAFQQSVGMIEADEYLAKRFQVQHHTKTIVERTPNKARLKVKTFDMNVMTGGKPVFVLLDELHLMSAINGSDRIIGQIRGGLMTNPEAVLVIITTQSDLQPAGAFKAELQVARGVRDGAIKNGRMLPLIYEFPEEMQVDQSWRNPDLWPMVLPNLGRSIQLPRLISEFEGAKDRGEGETRRWASQHLNIEIGVALHGDGWAGARYWESGAVVELRNLDVLLARCDVAVVGIDGGGLDDLLGLAIIGRDVDTRQWLGWARAWAQSDVKERRKEIAPRLDDFAREGDLTWCEPIDPTQDVREVVDYVERVHKSGKLAEKDAVGLDPVGIAAIVDELAERGIAAPQVIAVSQGYRLSSAVWGLERKLKDGTFKHDGSRLMTWCVGNAKAEQKGNAIHVTKEAAGKAKIDPLCAMFNAAMLMSRNPSAAAPGLTSEMIVARGGLL